VDKDPSKMTKEELEVFNCLEEEEAVDADENASAGYEELEDDFLMLANEGKPALEEAKEEDFAKAEYINKNVVIVENEEDEDQKALRLMREQLKKKFGGIIGMTEKIAAGGILKKPK
jgi:hypothetical protein